jgi:RNA-directed DNA polymerase
VRPTGPFSEPPMPSTETLVLVIAGIVLMVGLMILVARLERPDTRGRRRRSALGGLRYRPGRRARPGRPALTDEKPYAFARYWTLTRKHAYIDDSRDGDDDWLERHGLPVLHTPQEIADWLGLRIGQLAWLVHFDLPGQRPATERDAHYVVHWMRKRSGGYRLIESPKPLTRAAQVKILDEILQNVPTHPDAHGFVPGRSIVTNATPHVGRRVLLKFDLENFYPNVRFNRVVAIFRTIGYSREAACWLARLCTSAVPTSLRFPDLRLRDASPTAPGPYFARHLPQGAPTSPALANLSAFALDTRLSGLAHAYGARYTRYADDLTFSGSREFLRSFPSFIPFVEQVVRSERFRVNRSKRKVLRDNQRQTVTGVVVNERVNVRRADFDRLKAILHNCVHRGPSTQNRGAHPAFAQHLRGRIAHVAQLNPSRGEKLLELYERIDWDR